MLVGLVVSLAALIGLTIVVTMLGTRNGDRPDDARVTIRAVLEHGPDGRASGLFAEIMVDNRQCGPALVSARTRRTSAVAVAISSPHGRHIAIAHRRRLDDVEVLGAVEGGGIRRYLLPLGHVRGATKVTVTVDQAARRTRIVSATLPVARELPAPAAWPTTQPTRRELP